MRYIVDEDGAGAALGAVAAQLGARKAQFVADGPRQRLLLHDIGSPLLAIDVDGNEPFAGAWYLALQSGRAEQIVR